jgi:hypothetical protein
VQAHRPHTSLFEESSKSVEKDCSHADFDGDFRFILEGNIDSHLRSPPAQLANQA